MTHSRRCSTSLAAEDVPHLMQSAMQDDDLSPTGIEPFIEECFRLILEGDAAESRRLLRSAAQKELKGRAFGAQLAVEGITQTMTGKRNDVGLIREPEGFMRLEEGFRKGLGTIWTDEFDRGYWETWLAFVQYSIRQRFGGDAGQIDPRVVEDREQDVGTGKVEQ